MKEQLYGKILYHSITGYLTIVSDNHYIRKIVFGKQQLSGDVESSEEPPILQLAEQQLMEYLDGKRRTFDLPMLVEGTDFQKSVWNALIRIPFGSVKTYGALAREIGSPKSARAVGSACHKNPIVIIIPCHRVVGSNGSLTGFAGGISVKEALLQQEQNNSDKTI